MHFFALHLWKKCLDTHVENNLHWLSSHYTRDKHQGKEGTNVLIYCEEINKKSVSDPEYLLCASKIKLTKINVKKLHNHQSYNKPFRNQETITPTKLDPGHWDTFKAKPYIIITLTAGVGGGSTCSSRKLGSDSRSLPICHMKEFNLWNLIGIQNSSYQAAWKHKLLGVFFSSYDKKKLEVEKISEKWKKYTITNRKFLMSILNRTFN